MLLHIRNNLREIPLVIAIYNDIFKFIDILFRVLYSDWLFTAWFKIIKFFHKHALRHFNNAKSKAIYIAVLSYLI